jgi:hypothetical protein
MILERSSSTIYLSLGLIIGTYPEAGALVFALSGAYFLLRRTVSIGYWTWAFIVFGLVRGIVHWRSDENFFLGLLEGGFALSLYLSALYLRPLKQGQFVKGFVIGAVITAVVAIYFSFSSHLLPAQWQVIGDGRIQAQAKQTSEFQRFEPLEPRNAYITRDLGLQGSGLIQVNLAVRSETPIRLRLAVTHQDFDVRGVEQWCMVGTDWTTCQLEVRFKTRGVATLYLGGDQTWKASDGALDLRDLRVELNSWPKLGEWLRSLDRIKGWAFNPNAFAALLTMAVLTVSMTRIGWLWFGCVPLLIAVILSGSRGALLTSGLSIVFGLLFQLNGRKRLWFSAGFLLVCAWVFWGSGLSLPRALNWESQDGSNASRFTLYQSALNAWYSAVLFGVGDLTEAMRKRNAAEAGTITHAHNLFLQMLGEGGVLQLTVLFLMWMRGLISTFTVRNWQLIVFIALWLFFNQLDYLYWYAPVQMIFWFMLANSSQNFSKQPAGLK